MAKKISELELLTTLTGDEEGVIAVPGKNYRFKLRNIKTLIPDATKESVGLGNVENLAPSEMPVSTATAQALTGKAPVIHSHGIGAVVELAETLAQKSDVGHQHATSDVAGLDATLASKADNGHQHQLGDTQGLNDVLNDKASKNHGHTVSAIDGLPATIAAIEQALGVKANQTDLDQGLLAKAALHHTHDAADISGLSEIMQSSVTFVGNDW